MSRRYVARPVPKSKLIELAPSMSVESFGQVGFFAFGSGMLDVAELMARPDFEDVSLYAVIAEDGEIYFACAPIGQAIGYPPEFVRLRVVGWTDEEVKAAFFEELHAEGPIWEGVLLPGLTPAGNDRREPS